MVVLYILIILICVLLMAIVLVQNAKGGGLAADFSSSNQVMGVRKTADFLEKATWGLAIGLLVFCLAASAIDSAGTGADASAKSELYDLALEDATPVSVPQGTGQEAPAPQ